MLVQARVSRLSLRSEAIEFRAVEGLGMLVWWVKGSLHMIDIYSLYSEISVLLFATQSLHERGIAH